MSVSGLIRRGITFGKENGTSRLVRKGMEHGIRMQAESGYMNWLDEHRASEEDLEYQRKRCLAARTKYSILVPLYRTPEKYLREMIESVLVQSYPNWELCLADGSGDEQDPCTSVGEIVKEYSDLDARIRYCYLDENRGISENTNAALAMADGDYICLLDHDDVIEPDALYQIHHMMKAYPEMDVLYTDEDKVDGEGKKYFQPHWKPDFNLDLLRSNNYICHFFCVSRQIAETVGGFHQAYDGAQDYDFILRCTEQSRMVGHVPKILYHWRTHSASTAADPGSKEYAYRAGREAVKEHLKRCGLSGNVTEFENPGFHRVHYRLTRTPHVSIIVQGDFTAETRGQYAQQISARTEYPDFDVQTGRSLEEALRLSGVTGPEDCGDRLLLFLDRACSPMNKGWLKELVSRCVQEDAGCVTGRIYSERRTLLHAGEVLGMFDEVAACPYRGCPSGFYGYMHKITLQSETTIVTGKCLMIKEAVLRKAAAKERTEGAASREDAFHAFGFRNPGWNIKLCLITGNMGLRNCYTPFAVFAQSGGKGESGGIERAREELRLGAFITEHCMDPWAEALNLPDPMYNPNLDLGKGSYRF